MSFFVECHSIQHSPSFRFSANAVPCGMKNACSCNTFCYIWRGNLPLTDRIKIENFDCFNSSVKNGISAESRHFNFVLWLSFVIRRPGKGCSASEAYRYEFVNITCFAFVFFLKWSRWFGVHVVTAKCCEKMLYRNHYRKIHFASFDCTPSKIELGDGIVETLCAWRIFYNFLSIRSASSWVLFNTLEPLGENTHS